MGYPRSAKLLIIHADDLGLSHSENQASIACFEKGVVNSGSVMVPCPWFPEIAAYSVAHPQLDLGLHLTLTSEWKPYRWGPVLPRTDVPSLIDSGGFLSNNCQVVAEAKLEEVEKELRAQVDRAKQFGIDPTHFDIHMNSLLVFLKRFTKTAVHIRR
ncbi:MAG TPA: polysaccharide deacetylase family protein [Pyrinomonadaceae bacterium]|nr:polysaccharide deacetylase family protein [Pyrinomonadaceae bacterium]